MVRASDITVAAKCAPEESLLDAIVDAGLTATEIYTDNFSLKDIDKIVKICKKYPLRYALHAPANGYEPDSLVLLVEQIKAEVVIFHNIYWEDEWKYIMEKFQPLKCKPCMENIYSAVEAVKYMRRFGIGRCLDMEHLIMEVNGIFEEPFIGLIKESSHIHMTGYTFGSKAWHTPIHRASEQSVYLLNLLKKAGYSGLVVSEAQRHYQTKEEFKALREFFQRWEHDSL